MKTLAVIGNPNCGKTTFFNALTGAKQHVGNWSGVTVEKKEGYFEAFGQQFRLIDLPGTYSLDAGQESTSIDEKIAREFALSGEAELIINIVDASNLERNLYLTAQLAEMQLPVLVVLNMMDVAKRNGLHLDPATLEQELGCPVIAVSASRKHGLDAFFPALERALGEKKSVTEYPVYNAEIESAITELVVASGEQTGHASRWQAVRMLEHDAAAIARADVATQTQARALRERLGGHELDVKLAEARYLFAGRLAEKTIQSKGVASRSLTEHIDALVLNRFLGVPIFWPSCI